MKAYGNRKLCCLNPSLKTFRMHLLKVLIIVTGVRIIHLSSFIVLQVINSVLIADKFESEGEEDDEVEFPVLSVSSVRRHDRDVILASTLSEKLDLAINQLENLKSRKIKMQTAHDKEMEAIEQKIALQEEMVESLQKRKIKEDEDSSLCEAMRTLVPETEFEDFTRQMTELAKYLLRKAKPTSILEYAVTHMLDNELPFIPRAPVEDINDGMT